MEIGGLPLHPLVVHTVVASVPLAAALAIVLALLPRWRWLSRWPAAGVAVLAAVLTWVARLSGNDLLASRPELLQSAPLREQILLHQSRGELLSLLVIPFAALVVLAAWSLPGSTALASGRGSRTSAIPALEKVFPPVLVLASVGMLVLVVLTGDAGARAVWGDLG